MRSSLSPASSAADRRCKSHFNEPICRVSLFASLSLLIIKSCLHCNYMPFNAITKLLRLLSVFAWKILSTLRRVHPREDLRNALLMSGLSILSTMANYYSGWEEYLFSTALVIMPFFTFKRFRTLHESRSPVARLTHSDGSILDAWTIALAGSRDTIVRLIRVFDADDIYVTPRPAERIVRHVLCCNHDSDM